MPRWTEHSGDSAPCLAQRQPAAALRLLELRTRSGIARLGPGHGFGRSEMSYLFRGDTFCFEVISTLMQVGFSWDQW